MIGNDAGGLRQDVYGETALDRVKDHAENGTMKPQFREDLRAVLGLATRTTPASAGVLVEAAKAAEDAMREMFRYYDGGETRGSYDGKPERNGLRKAWYALRQALSTTATPASDGVTNEWRDINDAPHSTPIIAQYHEWNDPNGALAEHVVWFYAGGWRPYPMTVGDSYAERWKPLPTPTPDRFGEGYRAGLEAAGKWHDDAARLIREDADRARSVGMEVSDSCGCLNHYADLHDGHAANIRALQPATGDEA